MTLIPQPKPTKWLSQKYRDGAKGQPCTMQFAKCCNNDPTTTVLAHNNGGGMGTKQSDFDAADMCSSCHDAFDGRTDIWVSIDELTIAQRFERARYETLVNRITRGILK